MDVWQRTPWAPRVTKEDAEATNGREDGKHDGEDGRGGGGEGTDYSLLLQIILSRASSFAPRKWALVVPLASMDTGVPGEVATCGEATITC